MYYGCSIHIRDVSIPRNVCQWSCVPRRGFDPISKDWWMRYIYFEFLKMYLFKKKLFIYLFMAVLGLRFYVRAFSSCGKRGPLFIAVRGPLTIVASLVAEHRLQTRRLSSCGSRAQPLCGMWDPPGPGLEPMSTALAGRFSTTVPPGKPWVLVLNPVWQSLSSDGSVPSFFPFFHFSLSLLLFFEILVSFYSTKLFTWFSQCFNFPTFILMWKHIKYIRLIVNYTTVKNNSRIYCIWYHQWLLFLEFSLGDYPLTHKISEQSHLQESTSEDNKEYNSPIFL